MSPGENPKDKSILGSKNKQVESYLDDLAFAICINGEPIEKYKKIVSKQYGVDAYANMEKFAQALQQQVQVGQFTKTSLLSLKYIGKNAGMSENAIDMIVEHFNDKMKEAQQKKEEDECWKKCSGNDNSALLEYLRIYPNGRYAKQAQAKFKEEEAKREDTTFWKRCNQNDKRQLSEYLRKYPKGLYAPKAISLIADLERMEKEAIEESRMFNQCNTLRDYRNFLVKFPNGTNAAKAKVKIANFEKEQKTKQEEETFWKQCNQNDKHQLNEYLRKYPQGLYASRAKSLIANLEKIEKEAIEESRIFNQCHTQRDYLNFLGSYPNSVYAARAKIRLEEIERPIREENTYWSQCNDTNKDSLQRYLRKYPNGFYASQAKSLIADIEKKEKKEKKEKEAIEESRMYNQCRTKVDYIEYLRQHPNGLYKSQAQSKINEFDKSAAQERETYIQEQKIYDECKTKADYIHYLDLYPNGKFASRAHNKIEHFEKIAKIKKDVQNEKKEKQKEPINDRVPDEIQNKLKKLNKVAGYLYLIAALAFAFLPNVFRWNHWAYLEMEEYGDAPTLWLFWLPIVASLWGYYGHWLDSDIYMSKGRTGSAMKNDKSDRFSTLIPCLVLLAWMFIKGQDISALLSIYMESLHMFFMGPIVCGILWCAALYCEYKVSRIAKDLDSGND